MGIPLGGTIFLPVTGGAPVIGMPVSPWWKSVAKRVRQVARNQQRARAEQWHRGRFPDSECL